MLGLLLELLEPCGLGSPVSGEFCCLGESWLCFRRLGLSLSTGRFGAGSMLEVTFKRNAQRPPLYAATLEARSSFERFRSDETFGNFLAKSQWEVWGKKFREI